MKKKNTIALGLSGGVDSAVSAYLLKKQGYDITAVYLECWNMPGCRAEQDRKDALEVALQLNIPFKSLDFSKEYKEKVMGYFLKEYKAGRTPNPDVLCNQVIKFGMFYDWAMREGYNAIATGHYAQVTTHQDDLALSTAKDQHKDQTYFLHQLREEQLKHVLFPIGHLLKTEVREIAQQINLPIADKKDSVGICFVGEINVHDFLEENLGHNPGKVVTSDGQVIGKHDGLWFYTIGQRHGFKTDINSIKLNTSWINPDGSLPPLFVIGKNQQQNQLIIGPEQKTLLNQWKIRDLHWINQSTNWEKMPLLVRIRHTGKLIPCQLNHTNQTWQVITNQPLKGVASGQFSVFYSPLETNIPYQQFICLGGGVIADD